MRRVVLLLTGLWAGACTQAPPAAATEFPWLVGNWMSLKEGFAVTESWQARQDGGLLGVGHTRRERQTVFVESLSLDWTDGKFMLSTYPEGQAPVGFTLVRQERGPTGSSATFANAAHDFPKELTYSRLGADTLEVVATGENGREERFSLSKAIK